MEDKERSRNFFFRFGLLNMLTMRLSGALRKSLFRYGRGRNCSFFARGDGDQRLVLLEEQFMSSGSFAPGDVLFEKDRPVGVLMFHGFGLHFGARLMDQDCMRRNAELETRPGWKLNVVDGTETEKDLKNSLKFLESSERAIYRNQPRDIEREVITQGWNTGIVSVDAMTPIGRGQSMLFSSNFDKESVQFRDHFLRDIAIGILKSEYNKDEVRMWVCVPPKGNPSHSVFSLVDDLPRTTILNTCLEELDDVDVFGVLGSFAACRLAEGERDAGRHALLLLPDLFSHYCLWSRAQKLAKQYFQERERSVGYFNRGADRADLRQYYSALIQRAAFLCNGGSLTTLQGAVTLNEDGNSSQQDEEKVFELKELLTQSLRTPSEMNRLKLLSDRGIPFTKKNLGKIKIRVVDSQDEVKKLPPTSHAEELKSISDGHLVMNSKDALFDFDFRNSLTRIGIGINRNQSRDTRPQLLKQVAGPLRLELSSMLDLSPDDPHDIPEKVKRLAQALKHRLGHHFSLEEEVHLLTKLV